jgi:hypothetical protein
VFPHNIGLGATRNPRLVEQVEHVTAEETRATGPQWVFAPCMCVARDLRWGRTYESFSEHPGLVIKMETAIDGFQGRRARELSRPDRVLATAKHYAGDGDTEYGTGSGDCPTEVRTGVNAGIDMFMEPFSYQAFETTLLVEVAAGISRRTFFRYFADKEELFFAEDERLLQVIEDTLDGAPDGEPVLELARRATRALAGLTG